VRLNSPVPIKFLLIDRFRVGDDSVWPIQNKVGGSLEIFGYPEPEPITEPKISVIRNRNRTEVFGYPEPEPKFLLTLDKV